MLRRHMTRLCAADTESGANIRGWNMSPAWCRCLNWQKFKKSYYLQFSNFSDKMASFNSISMMRGTEIIHLKFILPDDFPLCRRDCRIFFLISHLGHFPQFLQVRRLLTYDGTCTPSDLAVQVGAKL